MSRDVAFAAVELVTQYGDSSGILFYGGEPLLEKGLIYDIVGHARGIKKKTGFTHYYKTTTNGTLLDEGFLQFAKSANLTIAFSHDGPAQDDCRVFPDGSGTFDLLEEKIPLLLKYQPYAGAMSVMDPTTVHNAASTVRFLFDKGFRYISLNLNYAKTAPWTRKHLAILEGEYMKMAGMYIDWTRAEEKFYLSPFDRKIASHLKGKEYNEDRRRRALNQPSVAIDGKIYPGSRFIGDPAFEIGDVFSGIDAGKHRALYEKGWVPSELCMKCTLLPRCNYACDGMSRRGTEIVNDVLPVQCAHEKIIAPIADSVAETLYKEGNALFVHKHYNEQYVILSLLEDISFTT
jgi:uncharacterized protein